MKDFRAGRAILLVPRIVFFLRESASSADRSSPRSPIIARRAPTRPGSLGVGRVFEADIDAVAVRAEPFLVGEQSDVGGDLGQAVAVEVNHAGPLEEVVRAQARGPAGGAAGRQDVR